MFLRFTLSAGRLKCERLPIGNFVGKGSYLYTLRSWQLRFVVGGARRIIIIPHVCLGRRVVIPHNVVALCGLKGTARLLSGPIRVKEILWGRPRVDANFVASFFKVWGGLQPLRCAWANRFLGALISNNSQCIADSYRLRRKSAYVINCRPGGLLVRDVWVHCARGLFICSGTQGWEVSMMGAEGGNTFTEGAPFWPFVYLLFGCTLLRGGWSSGPGACTAPT